MEPNKKKCFFSVKSSFMELDRQTFFYSNIRNNYALPKPKSKIILIVLDKSGSMEGENIEQCRKVMKLLFTFFRTSLPDASLNLITFDMRTFLTKDMNLLPIKSVENIIDQIQADSSTYFTGVLKHMEEFISSKKKVIEDLSIIFMTDGQIVVKEEKNNNFKLLNDQIESLSLCLNKCTKDCDIHTIGLGKEHDPFFLEKLLTLKPLNSTYLFIIDDTGIEPSFKAVKDMISLNNIKANLNLVDLKGKKMKLTKEIIVKENEQENEDREWEIFQNLDIDVLEIDMKMSYLEISVANGGNLEMKLLAEIVENNVGEEELLKFHLIKIRNELQSILNTLKHYSQENKIEISQLDHYTMIKIQLFKEFNQIFLKIFKIKNMVLKKELFALSEEMSPLMNVIDELLSSGYISKIKNELLAKAVQISHKNINKKRYIKDFKGSISDLVSLFNKQDEQIAKISHRLSGDRDIFEQKYKNLAEEYVCFLTSYNFIETIADQDCLCVSFSVSRSEASIMAPSKMKINAIYPTIISAQSFLYAIKYSINLNFSDNSIQKERIIKGVAQESINAAIPIFLCKEHWEIGRILIDRILGWIVALDPLLYHIRMKLTLPFLLLEFNIKECYKTQGNQFNMKYFRLLLETCLNILLDESFNKDNNLKDRVSKHLEIYQFDGIERLPEKMSTRVFFFFIQQLCAMILGWIHPKPQQIEEIYFFAVEEELRLFQVKEFNSYKDYENINLMTKSQEEQEQIIDKYLKKYNSLFIENCLVLALVKNLMMQFNGNIENFNFKDIKPIESDNALLNETKLGDKNALFALFFQNQLHHDNATRKKAFQTKTYVDCRKNWKEVLVQYSENVKNASEKRNQQLEVNKNPNIDVSTLRKKFRNLVVLEMLNKFKETDDLEKAGDLLDKCFAIKPGRVLDYNIYLFRGEIVLPSPKLKLFKEKHLKYDKLVKLNMKKKFYGIISL